MAAQHASLRKRLPRIVRDHSGHSRAYNRVLRWLLRKRGGDLSSPAPFSIGALIFAGFVVSGPYFKYKEHRARTNPSATKQTETRFSQPSCIYQVDFPEPYQATEHRPEDSALIQVAAVEDARTRLQVSCFTTDREMTSSDQEDTLRELVTEIGGRPEDLEVRKYGEDLVGRFELTQKIEGVTSVTQHRFLLSRWEMQVLSASVTGTERPARVDDFLKQAREFNAF
ncbi:hypothetical protein GCM10007276_34430 [Agaricicola taiwanensis]|uniref:Uncharacterized protein n=1 Tax=Agaricicola taiwanensis TaxID=591372 RepID=A0A8J3E0I5_9RHOB|nr:hypothetical protein [Agaricicola taiwanensis]GGE54487.1 hypothetical protein GCM10007276_34430 [Agaricicola taiwanensis]